MPSQPISDMTDRRPGKNTDRSGGSEDDADFLGEQPPLAKQRWQEWRLHAECRIEESINSQECRQGGRPMAHHAQAMMRRTAT